VGYHFLLADPSVYIYVIKLFLLNSCRVLHHPPDAAKTPVPNLTFIDCEIFEMTDVKSPIIIGCDHAAYDLKEKVKAHLKDAGFEVQDAGAHSEASVDYPDYGIEVAGAVSNGTYERGILICGTGIGMSMVANRFPHVRAALCGDLLAAIICRQHNNANILVMGARMVGDVLAMAMVKAWLETPFEGGRHSGRLQKFDTVDHIPACTKTS
jgi:ribose 5-phosphate isomerase B